MQCGSHVHVERGQEWTCCGHMLCCAVSHLGILESTDPVSALLNGSWFALLTLKAGQNAHRGDQSIFCPLYNRGSSSSPWLQLPTCSCFVFLVLFCTQTFEHKHISLFLFLHCSSILWTLLSFHLWHFICLPISL